MCAARSGNISVNLLPPGLGLGGNVPRPIGGPENEEAVIPSSGRAGEGNRERKQPQCSLDSIPFHFGGAVGVP